MKKPGIAAGLFAIFGGGFCMASTGTSVPDARMGLILGDWQESE